MGRERSATIRSFQDLRVYQGAFAVAQEVFELSHEWPKREQYALTDQVRRSSRSVCANIAEAWYRRRYPKAFVSNLYNAGAEASETLVWIDFAVECGYLGDGRAAELRNELNYIIGGLTRMAQHPNKWCSR